MGKGRYQLSAESKALVVKTVMYHLYRKANWNGKEYDMKKIIKEYDMKKIIENQIHSLTSNFMGQGVEVQGVRCDHRLANRTVFNLSIV